MRTEDFAYNLPEELIAQQPRRRGSSRLLVLPQPAGEPLHERIMDLPKWLRPGDCLVVNDSKVIPARLRTVKRPTGAQIELLLHRQVGGCRWEALARPCRKLQAGTRLGIGATEITVISLEGNGRVLLEFPSESLAKRVLQRYGEPPLPPYIRRPSDANWQRDRKRYQTVYARQPGSVAAPTAGLHFSVSLLRKIAETGVEIVPVTLHVGWGTFAPLPAGEVSQQHLHPERFSISQAAAQTLAGCRRRGGRVIACGTTTARALEAAAGPDGSVQAQASETDIFIRDGYRWKVVNGLLTNFHLPESSLLMLVCALAGRERVLQAYAEAVRQKYHFYSYGDAMLLL